jgi:hypothetical protein
LKEISQALFVKRNKEALPRSPLSEIDVGIAMSHYKKVVIETYTGPRETHQVPHARPLPGQGFDTGLKVECSKAMRRVHPIGSKFLIEARVKEAYGTKFLYSHHAWGWKLLTELQAQDYIRRHG